MKKFFSYLRYLTIALLVAVAFVLAFPASALAIDNPDTLPEINEVYVYKDCLLDGDIGVMVDYYLDYDFTDPITGTPVPDETATEAYLVIFVDSDGVTQLKTVAPYAFENKGYGRGLVWLYFTPAEVTAYGLDAADIALYRIWLMGNPTLTWSGAVPETVGLIDYWQPSGITSTLVSLKVLQKAIEIEQVWGEALITATGTGNKLNSAGEEYFMGLSPDMKDIAPLAFSSMVYKPTIEALDYSTSFGAVMTDGTGTVTGSPITLTEGDNTVAVTVTGTFTLELNSGTVGTVEDDTGVVAGSPVDLVAGTNTITVTSIGDLKVTVNLNNTETGLFGLVIGTSLDLTDLAARFGMSRWMFSGLVWIFISVVICAATYWKTRDEISGVGGGKLTFLVFDICILGGIMLGLLHPIVGAVMFIGFTVFVGYILFFRQANA